MKSKFEVPLFGGRCYFFTSKKEYIKASSNLGIEQDLHGIDGRAESIQHDNGVIVYFIGVFNGRLSTLVHEVAHISLFISNNVGLNAYDSASEPVCYLNQRIFEECYKTFKKVKK